MKNATEEPNAFIQHMQSKGWVTGDNQYELVKGDWKIVFDTSSWIEVGTKQSLRIFDVPVPDEYMLQWT